MLENFSIVQSYVTALIIVVASAIWFKLRNEGYFEDSKFARSISALFLLTIFFLIRILHFVPLEIKEIYSRQLCY